MNDMPAEPSPGTGGGEGTEIGRLFSRIVSEPDFKQLLLSDPDTALQGYDLTQTQIMMVKSLDEEDFGKLTPENLTEYFSADAAVYTPDEADITDDDAYSAEDFLDHDDEYDSGDEDI